MTESLFDPTGDQTEHSGNRNMGPSADNISHMPSEVVDGQTNNDEQEASPDEDAETEEIARAEDEVEREEGKQ